MGESIRGKPKAKAGRNAADERTEEPARRAKAESELYEPVKRWLESRGYTVRGEVRGCDVVAVREGEAWPVIVELKKRFNLSLFLQALDRLAASPCVYVAAEKRERGNAFSIGDLRRLCGMLGIGLLTVRLYKRKPAFVELHCEPAALRIGEDVGSAVAWSGAGNSAATAAPEPAAAASGTAARKLTPAKPGRRTERLLKEFNGRTGDYNAGGSTGRELVTAYRERALRCAEALKEHGPLAPRQVRDLISSELAASILQRNVYGWFRRISRGVYALTPAGEKALERYADVLGGPGRREP